MTLSIPVRFEIDLRNVLWRTRGRHWDYAFLLVPEQPSKSAWFHDYREIFDGMEPSRDKPAINLCGKLSLPTFSVQPFVATCFVDPTLQDDNQRPIKHFFIWFYDNTFDSNNAPTNWGSQLVAALNAVFIPRVFGLLLSQNQISDYDKYVFNELDAELNRSLPDRKIQMASERTVESRISYQDVGLIGKKKNLPIESIQSLFLKRSWLIVLGCLTLLVIVALLCARLWPQGPEKILSFVLSLLRRF